ncbi:MAG: DUF87 domain-containing protein [Candidatus Diapherotrites archaeon]|nr:DUF87 domain-containing protein [Candidatus Diapherotrites archaeon]
MEDFLGTVISTFTSPSPSEMNFVVTSGNVHRGQFVEVDYSEGTIVALITNVVKTNRYFERADSVKEFEARGSALFEQFPTSEWEYLIANTRPLGVFNKGRVSRSSFPPSPGAKVRLAKAETLKNFFKFDEEKGMNLGKVEFHDLDVKINMTKLLKKHLAILSISGAGKSYFTSVLFEELLDRKKENGRIACVVLDPHGEYSSFAEPVKDKEHSDYSDRTLLVKGRNVRIAVPSLSVGMLAGIITGLSGPQKRDLKKILIKLNSEMKSGLGPFDFDSVKKEILQDAEIKENTKGPLLGWIAELEQMHLFAKIDSPSARDVVRPGFLTIIDLSDIIDIKKKQVIVSHFANKLFSERRKKTIPPFLLVMEEAHQFCLSEDTEILTAGGWKKYIEVGIGDLAFSYNKETNKLEINPIKRIIVRPHEGKLVRLFNEDSIDSLVSDDHRVLCNVRTTGADRKWKWSKSRFVPAKNLPSGARIPVAAGLDSESECKIDSDLVKVIGWIISDGNLHSYHGGKQSYYEISQSKAKGKILDEIMDVVPRRFPEAKVHSRKRTSCFDGGAKRIARSEEFTFYLGAEATKEIKAWLGNIPHRIPRKFLENASQPQLKILFDALVQGDGSIQYSKNKHKYVIFYAGYDAKLADDFQELCVRLGFSAVIKHVPSNKQTKVLVSFKRKHAFVRKTKEENFSGKTWDITIQNGAFVARRNGKAFITGNCPERVSEEQAVSRGIIRTIAREGRKFGASICLVSQRPVQLDTTALSQCNTKIILRITNPYDLKHIAESAEAIDQRSLEMITSLQVGEALVIGEAVNYPLFFKVRERKSLPSKHEISLEDAAVEFESSKKKSDEETEAFL